MVFRFYGTFGLFSYNGIWLSDSFWYGHTGTYRTTAIGRGAFELCLPSLGNFYQNPMLRRTILGRTHLLKGLWGEEAWVSHRGQDEGSPPLQHYVLLTVLVRHSI